MLLCYVPSSFKTFACTVPTIQNVLYPSPFFTQKTPIYSSCFLNTMSFQIKSGCHIMHNQNLLDSIFLIGIDQVIIRDLLHLILETINSVLIVPRSVLFLIKSQNRIQHLAYGRGRASLSTITALSQRPTSPRLALLFLNRMVAVILVAKNLEQLNNC